MNIFELFGTIAIDNQGANKAITDTSKHAGKMHAAMQQSFEKVGKAAVACGKVIATGAAAGTAALGALAKLSIGGYANYEQLVGGIETLFKESQDKVMEYAKNAYKTAGLSANQYMETATSFSASLLKGLGGDTEKAAEYTQIAITDMSDNANKMGTDMGMIQNAYQGFAKQNYTMLDNLKLGYGGTQEEMARLVNESGVLGAAIKVDARTINEVSFDKIIQAIHIIQERMGITGTTAKEAAETISGSVASFRATWANLLTGLSSDDQNLDELWKNFTLAGETVIRNVGRILPNLLRNIKNIFGKATQYAGQMIQKGWTETIWPFIQEKMKIHFGIELPDWETLKRTISAKWKEVMTAFHEGGLFKAFEVLLPDWNTLAAGISDGWEKIVWPIVQGIFKTVFKVELPDWETLKARIVNGWENIVWPRVQGYFSTIFNVELPDWESLKQAIISGWNNGTLMQDTFKAVFGVEPPDWSTMKEKITTWWNGEGSAYEKIKEICKWTLGDFVEPKTEEVIADVKTWWTNIVQPKLTKVVQWTFGELVLPAWADLVESATNWWNNDIVPAFKNMADFFAGEIQWPTWEEIKASAEEWWNSITGGLSSIFTYYANIDFGKTYTPEELANATKGGHYEIDTTAGATTPVFVPNGSSTEKPRVRGYAAGLDRVYEDERLVRVHKDEAILNAAAATAWRSGQTVGGTGKLEALMSQMNGLLQRMAENAGMGQNIVLDSGVLVGQLAPAMNAKLGTISERNRRGNS